jgi:hypothetical protein
MFFHLEFETCKHFYKKNTTEIALYDFQSKVIEKIEPISIAFAL